MLVSVSQFVTNFLLQLIDLPNTFYVNIFYLKGTAINHFSIIINKSYFLVVIKDVQVFILFCDIFFLRRAVFKFYV